jgi:serine/threonine protein kinase/tetratricopeptide (TPR) repeat protein
MKICPQCGATYPDEYNVCPQDGAPLPSSKATTAARIIDGKYQIVRMVGRGGMGAVYEAIHATMQRRVALKILNTDLVSNPAALERFRREALLSGRLKHPNAITIYDYGMSAVGEAYIVMEFLEGHSLSHELQQVKAMSPMRVASVLAAVCDAVHAAHIEGIIHRDLKPANIMIERLRTGETVKVLDFGIAKLAMSNPNLMNLTGTGIIGTPQYMSPEQCQAHKIDARSDVYSIGIIAYEMLVGKLPFDEPTPLATVIAQVKHKPKPIRDTRPDVPPPLEAVVMKALEKAPAKRQQTAEELANDFRTVLRQIAPSQPILHTPAGLLALPEERPGKEDASEPPDQKATRFVPKAVAAAKEGDASASQAMRLMRDSVGVPTGVGGGEFVGRTPELGVLIAAWHSVNTRRGRPVVIFGEPGIGKTRLVEQFLVRLEDIEEAQPLFLRAKCTDQGKKVACHGIIESIRPSALAYFNPELRAVRSFTPDEEKFLNGEFLRALRSDGYGPTLNARARQSDTSRKAFFEDLTRACLLLARQRGAVLFVDDAQAADDLTLEFIGFLARKIGAERLLIVAASRPLGSPTELSPPLRTWLQSLDDIGGYDQIKLPPLSNSEIRLMVEGLLGARVQLPVNVALLLAEETKGNPYYVSEVVNTMIGNGQIVHSDESGWVCNDVDEFDLPDSIVSLVKPLIERLDERVTDVLAHAAVIGEEFTFDMLQAITEDSEDDLLKVIEVALKAGILREMASRRDDRYLFPHGPLHRVLYRRITRRRRKRLHARIAEHLEKRAPSPLTSSSTVTRLDFLAGDLAYHYFRADEWRKAVEYGLEAGYARWNSYSFADAGKYFGWCAHALERLAEFEKNDPSSFSPDELARYHLTYGTLLVECAHVEDAEKELQRALALCQTHELPWLGRTQAMLGRLCNLSGLSEEALEYAQAGLDRLRKRNDAVGIGTALMAIGESHLMRGRHKVAQESIHEALHVAEKNGDRPGLATAKLGTAIVEYQRGNYAEALNDVKHSLAIARSLGNIFEERRALNLLGNIHLQLGQIEEAQECHAGSLRIAYALGHRHAEAASLNHLGEVFAKKENYGEAIEYIQQAIGIAREVGNNAAEARYLLNVGRIRRRRGDLKSALNTLNAALLISETVETRRVEAEIQREIGEVHRLSGEFQQAESNLHSAVEIAREVNFPQLLWRTLHGLAQCKLEVNDYDGARTAIDESIRIISALQNDLPDDVPAGRFLVDKRPVFDFKTRLEREAALAPPKPVPPPPPPVEVKATEMLVAPPPPPGITTPLVSLRPPELEETPELPVSLDALANVPPAPPEPPEPPRTPRIDTGEFTLEELLDDVAQFAEQLGMGNLFSEKLSDVLTPGEAPVQAVSGRFPTPSAPISPAPNSGRQPRDTQTIPRRSLQTVMHSVVSLESTWRDMLQTARASGDREIERKGLTLMASALHSQGEVARARDCYQRAVQILREINDRSGEGALLNNIGDTFRQEGRYADALAYYRLALRSAREYKNTRVIEFALVNAGQMYVRTGNVKDALAMLSEAQGHNETTGDPQARAEGLQALGEVRLIRKEFVVALEHSLAAVEAAREVGGADVEWRALWVIARCRWGRGERIDAVASADAALFVLDRLTGEANPHDEKRLVRERNDLQAVVDEWRRITDEITV